MYLAYQPRSGGQHVFYLNVGLEQIVVDCDKKIASISSRETYLYTQYIHGSSGADPGGGPGGLGPPDHQN